MDRPVQGKRLYVVLLLIKYLYVCRIGLPSLYFPSCIQLELQKLLTYPSSRNQLAFTFFQVVL